MEKEVVDGNIGIDFEKVLWNKNFNMEINFSVYPPIFHP